jgi:hypothetical protein
MMTIYSHASSLVFFLIFIIMQKTKTPLTHLILTRKDQIEKAKLTLDQSQ